MAQPMLREIFEKGEKVDLAFLSVGELTPTCTMTRVGLVSRAEVDDLLEAGAVGDICAHWIDDEGRLVDHPLNSRVVALSPGQAPRHSLRRHRVGRHAPRSPALAGRAEGWHVRRLITDEQTAKAILAMEAK